MIEYAVRFIGWLQKFGLVCVVFIENFLLDCTDAAGCGGMLQTTGSTFTTPKYPGKYPPNTECTWDIRVKEGYFVTLNFIERFDLEQSTGCSGDVVEVGHYYIMHTILKEHICTLSCYM